MDLSRNNEIKNNVKILNQVSLNADEDKNDSISSDINSTNSDSLSLSSLTETIVRQKSKWCWLVVLASMVIHMIADGVCFSYGVLLYKLKDDFDVSKDKVALVGSLLGGIPLFMGPLCSFLINRFSCRSVTVIGGLLTAIGFFISSFVTKFNWFYLTISIISGFGLSLVYVPAVVIVAYYFDEKRSLATGLAVSGTGTGYALFAPLIDIMLEKYNWNGTMRILSGCFIIIAFCGLLFKPIEYKIEKKTKPKRQNTKQLRKRILKDSRLPSQMNSIEKLDKFIERLAVVSIEDESKSTSTNCKTENDGLLNVDDVTNKRFSSSNLRRKRTNTESKVDNDSDEEILKPKHKMLKSFSIAVLPSFYLGIEPKTDQFSKITQKQAISVKEVYLKKNKQEILPNEANKNSQIWDLIDRNMIFNRDEQKEEVALESNELMKVNQSSKDDETQTDEAKNYYLTSVLGNLAGFLGKFRQHQHTDTKSKQINEHIRLFQMPLSRKDIFYRGSLMNIRRTLIKARAPVAESSLFYTNENHSLALSCPNLYTKSRYSLLSASESSLSSSDLNDDNDNKCHLITKRIYKTIKHIIPINILKNPSFLLFCFANFIFYMWHETPMMFIRDYTDECKCIEKHRIWILLISCGLANAIGQWIYGYFGDKENVNEKILYAISTIICGITVLTIPLVLHNYTLLLINQILFGIFVSANFVLNSIILVEILGVNKLTNAYGLLLLVQGFALVIGSPIAGWIGDTTGNYNNTFYYSGFFVIVSGIILLFLPLTERLYKRSQLRKSIQLKKRKMELI